MRPFNAPTATGKNARNAPIWSAGASLAYPITKSLEIETAYDFFSSRTAASSSFERGTGRLALRHVF